MILTLVNKHFYEQCRLKGTVHNLKQNGQNGIMLNSIREQENQMKRSLPVVFSQGKEKVLGKVIEAQFLGGSSKTINLEVGLDCGIHQELIKSGI